MSKNSPPMSSARRSAETLLHIECAHGPRLASGTISHPCAATQAMATCATEAPIFSAIPRSFSTRARFTSKFLPWKRGLVARKSCSPWRAFDHFQGDGQEERRYRDGGQRLPRLTPEEPLRRHVKSGSAAKSILGLCENHPESELASRG